MRAAGAVALGLAVALLPAGLRAAAPEPEAPVVLLERAPAAGTGPAQVGDRIPLRAVVTIPPGYRIEEPRAAGAAEDLTLLPAGPPQGEAAPGGAARREYPLDLLVLGLGELSFAGVAVPWTGPGGATGVARSEPLTVTVTAAVEDPLVAEAADIRGPAELPVPFRPPWWWWALAAAALLATGLAWWLRRRPAAPERAAGEADPFAGLGPADWALRELEELGRGELLGRSGVEAFHVRLSEILRRYLEGQFGIPALERTSFEILADVEARLRPLPGTRSRLRDLLAACDLVKFARLRPDGESALGLVREAGRVVSETRPAAPIREAAS